MELSIFSEPWASQFENELRKWSDQYIAALRTLSGRFANILPTCLEGGITRALPEVLCERLPSAGSSASLTSVHSSIRTLQSLTEESTFSGRFWKA